MNGEVPALFNGEAPALLNGEAPKTARVFDYCGAKTHAYYVEQVYLAILMIEQLIQCALNYEKTPTLTLITHNGTG